jgi:GPH family glycoside/pentoside/hexuronide:cation symporter
MADTKVPAGKLLAYGGPIVGASYLLFFVQFYFLKFATDVLLLPPVAVGALFALVKMWDAASNPLIGSWSDRTRSRFGRRQPFLYGALPLLLLGFVMLWNPPLTFGAALLVAWSGVALFVFQSAFALYMIPHAALGAEMSNDSHERTRLFGAKQIAFTVGMLVAFAGIQVAMNAAEPRTAAGLMAIPAAVAVVVALAITPLLIRERAETPAGGQSLVAGLRDVWANRPARLLLFVWFIENLGVGAVGTMAPYISEYLVRRPDLVGTLPASYVIAGVVTIPIWVRISRSVGARDTWLAAMLMAAVAFGGMMFVGPGDVALIVVLLVFAGCAMGCGSVLSSSIMADLIDDDERRTGERKEGIYSASMMFALRVGNSLATALSGLVLSATGFVPNAEQSAESLLGIRLLFAGLPAVGFVAGAMLFLRFPRARAAVPAVEAIG